MGRLGARRTAHQIKDITLHSEAEYLYRTSSSIGLPPNQESERGSAAGPTEPKARKRGRAVCGADGMDTKSRIIRLNPMRSNCIAHHHRRVSPEPKTSRSICGTGQCSLTHRTQNEEASVPSFLFSLSFPQSRTVTLPENGRKAVGKTEAQGQNGTEPPPPGG